MSVPCATAAYFTTTQRPLSDNMVYMTPLKYVKPGSPSNLQLLPFSGTLFSTQVRCSIQLAEPCECSSAVCHEDTMNIPGLDVRIHIDLLYKPITDINLCVHFTPQGNCDEQGELSVKRVPRARKQVDPPRANHFSLWLGFGGADAIMLDITQDCPPHDPFSPDPADSRLHPSLVRLATKSIPTDDDIGCVLRELNIRKGTTIGEIVQLCLTKRRQLYRFLPIHKQQAGCRHWIHVIAQDLELAGIVGKGYGDDVFACLQTYYNRYPYQTPSRRWESSGNWGPRTAFVCADVMKGSFYSEVLQKQVSIGSC